jgi:hypothetical protein
MKSLVLLSFSLAFLTQGFADDSFATEPSGQVASDEEMLVQPEDSQPEWCLSPYHEMHASIRHNEANGIGYKEGYTTLEAFGIYDGWGSSFMPFVDIRGHVFNNGKLAGNLGIGERTLFDSINHTFGSYLYYDVRRVGHGLTVNQLSPGFELVGERMEYRINGYFPLGKNKGNKFGYDFDKFTGNNILLKYKQNQAMRGGDAEVGVHIPQNTSYDVYAAAGPYYFHSSNASAWGGRARLLGRYKEYVTLEVAYSYDKLFRNVVQGSIAFTVPFGGKLQRCGQGCNRGCPQDNLLLSRAAFAPSRFEIPVVKKVHKRTKAIDPATGLPWVVWFVNNTSHSAGTFESPFTTIAAASAASSPNDMIYVFPGNTQYNEVVLLQDGQSFFGSGIKQQFSTTKGTQTIPAMSSNNPSITNAAGNVVTVGNGNIVSGFNISVASSNGITNTGSINGTTIVNNSFTCAPNGSNGMVLTGFGEFNISNNQFTTPAPTGGSAIALTSSGGSMNGVINNNTVFGFAGGLFLSPVGAGYNLTIEGNTLTNFVSIAMLLAMPEESTLNIIGNTFNSNAGTVGIKIQPGAFPIFRSLVIDNNQVILNSASAIDGIFLVTGPLNAVISNNFVESTKGAGFTGINVTATNTGDICLDLNMNTVVTVPGATAYGFTATSGTLNIASIEGNVGGPPSSTGAVNLVPAGSCDN